jgi:predicted ferric reductase
VSALRILIWALAIAVAGFMVLGSSFDAVRPELASEHVYWHLGRASGFVAYGLLVASVVLGLAISSRVFDGLLVRPWVFEMHQFLSIYVLIAMVFHAFIMLPDQYAQFSVQELAVPFAASYHPIALGLGGIALYGSVIVSASFYVKKHIGQQAWRLLHYLTFVLFVLALVHGVFAGTDSGEQWAQLTYLSTGLMVLFFTFFRILAARRAGAPAKPKAKPRLAEVATAQ